MIFEENILSIADSLHQGKQFSDDEFFQAIDIGKKNVYVCPVCSRMHVEHEVGANVFDTYVLEGKPQQFFQKFVCDSIRPEPDLEI